MSTASQILPEASATELPPDAAFAPTSFDEVLVFAGPSSKGPLNAPRAIADRDTLVATFGTGPAVKEAAYLLAKVAAPIVFLRLASATVAATKSSATVVKDNTSTFTSTLSGTPTDGADIVIQFTLGGTTGTGPIDYQVSLDGGITYGSTIHLLTGTSITVLGVSVALGPSHVVTTGDTIAWWQMPASSTVLPLTFTGTGTSVITVSGTPNDAYEVAFKVITGGTIGTAGIKFQIALDYGAPVPTWTDVTSLGTDNTYAVNDGPISTEPTGLTLNFAAGTLVAGDILTFNTTGPTYDAAGATNGLSGPTPQTVPATGLLPWNGSWTFVYLVGAQSESVIAGVDTIVSGWASSQGVNAWGVCATRDRGTTETLAAWSSRVQTEFASYNSTYVGVSAGKARVTCPINGRNNRRAAFAVCAPRAVALPIYFDWSQFDLNSLDASVRITDINNQTVEHDARVDPQLNAMGFITLRTWQGATGVYPTKAALMAPSTNIQLIPLRRVMNVALKLQRQVNQMQAVKSARVYKAGDKLPQGFAAGDYFAADLNKIRRLGNDIFTKGLVSTGFVSGYTFTVQQTPVPLGGGNVKLVDKLSIVARVYIVKADGTAQFVSATLDVLGQKPS